MATLTAVPEATAKADALARLTGGNLPSPEVQAFELAQRQATLLANSTLIPKEFQKHIANCYIAMNLALRLKADVLLVMQNLYVVHGRPGWSAQFLTATCNQSGRFSALRYEFIGEAGKDTYGCRAYAIEKETGERLDGPPITMAMVKAEGWLNKAGSKWQTIPDLMFRYRAAAWFVRTYAPEIAMGLPTADELADRGTDEPEWKAAVPTHEVIEAKLVPAEGPSPMVVPADGLDDAALMAKQAAAAAEFKGQPQPTPEDAAEADAIRYADMSDEDKAMEWIARVGEAKTKAELSKVGADLAAMHPDTKDPVRKLVSPVFLEAQARVRS